MDKGAVKFGSSVNSRIFLIGSKPRNDRGFFWFWFSIMMHLGRQSAVDKFIAPDTVSPELIDTTTDTS